ncbi:hypothetical protein H112_00416 [Trichophyton rubrum D6]|nr:hypothetical protein H102_00415 [Trichophyton rubrum CBS 100081]EZF89327.1 hypothetical protein H110_00419 [Trichophyton rubrum MR1448]EZG00103.1 hypothetical protein H113_00419 [Trichophyton rubrum MR1459]KDB38528.1 hypothetical protein H112_00416 [Trichophyton rubrum D6]
MEILPHEDQAVLSALDTLSFASIDTLIRLQEPIRKAFGQVNRKLASQSNPLGVQLLDAILNSLPKIQKWLQGSEEKFTARQWTSEDPRVTDLRRTARRSTDDEKFRSYLAERSLAAEKEHWELENYKTSRVNELVADIQAASEDHNDTIKEFLKFKALPNERFIYEGIKRGQKYLVNERLHPRHRGTGAIYSRQIDKFRRIQYRRLPALHELLAHTAYQAIHQLVVDKSVFIDRCQASYDDGTNRIILLLTAGPQHGLPLRGSASQIPLIGAGHDGSNDQGSPAFSVRQREVSTTQTEDSLESQASANYTQSPGGTSCVRRATSSLLPDIHPVHPQNRDRSQDIYDTSREPWNIPAEEDHLLPSQGGTTARSSINNRPRSTTEARSSPHSENTSYGDETTSTPPLQTNQGTDRLQMLVEAAETHAEQTKKRPCPDNGSQCPDLRRRRLSEQTEGDNFSTRSIPSPRSEEAGSASNRILSQDSLYSAAGVASEPRQLLFPENDAQRFPRATTLSNAAQQPTGTPFELDPNFTVDAASWDKSAPYQSPQRTTIRANVGTTTSIQYDPFVGSDSRTPPVYQNKVDTSGQKRTDIFEVDTEGFSMLLRNVDIENFSMLPGGVDTEEFSMLLGDVDTEGSRQR